jgi:GAF domain-containing protein
LHVIGAAGMIILAVTAVAALASVGWRFYRGDATIRAQLRWLLATLAVIAVTIALPGPKALGPVILALHVIAVFLLPVTLAVTLVRRDGLVLPRLLLHAPYTAVILPGDAAPAASAGRPSHPEIVVPLSLRGTQAGSLVVAQRSPKEHYSERDLALLQDLARHIAVAAHAATLTRDLQRSRGSLVAAREKYWSSSPAACPTARSPARWSSHPRPCVTTSATSSPNSKSTIAPKQ